ncbi:DUF5131 family protein [Actinomadura kijaniata]|uniref:DUF5131 family protein n=1 Tax=Actinomadura kijaniata TaxID=46161 RepID=UPI003F194CA2
MSDHSRIEWTDATWNPVTGCTKVSPGCDHCYAATFAERWRGVPGHHFTRGFDLTPRPERLTQPLRWRRPRRIFVNSMSDLFHADITDAYIARVFAVMALTERHTYQVLTKRPGRARALLTDRFASYVQHILAEFTGDPRSLPAWPLPNVWLGVSAETQKWADVRVPTLLATPAAVRFVSAEPLLGPIDLTPWLTCDHDALSGANDTDPDLWQCDHCTALLREVADPGGPITVSPCDGATYQSRFDLVRPGRRIDWVITGGESGPGARPADPDWFRWLRDQCQAAGVAYFHKQNGPKKTGRLLDGRTWDQLPDAA